MCAIQLPTGGRYRLPTTVVPSFYDLRVEPDLDKFTFAGEEKIDVAVHEPTDKVVLNSADLKIHEAILLDKTGTKLIGSIHHDEAEERVTIKFDGIAGAGDWQLLLKYTGPINEKLKSFYRSSYKNAAGQEKFLVTTKFEPCDARKAFPCFDEPAFKARFKMSLLIDEGLNGVSNCRLMKTTKLGNGKKLLEFAPTPPMSSYLVAWRVGDFVSTKPMMVGGKPVSVVCVPGKEHLAEFALGVAKHALEYFTKYFEHPYVGDKLDLCAIPDFASGAMEDLGCISFREALLLIDPNTASHAELLRVAEVICHEIAHMWFGDFVTMSWWNGLWLNEAFATFMASKCVDAFRPDWKFWEGFNVDRAGAMKTDGLIETRSIEFPVNNPDDARQMFDVLTYEKGCAILRMLELFLGEDNFRKGIVNYLSKHAFGNADTKDLWAAIEEKTEPFADNVNVTALMNTWVFQPGHPIVEVSESPVTGSVVLKQRLFRYLTDANTPKMLWQIPVHLRATVRGANGGTETVDKVLLLSNESETFYIGEDVSSLVVNAGGNGFFRVNYSDGLRAKLVDNLPTLSASERFNFVNDMWASVQSGSTPLTDYLTTVSTLTNKFGEKDLNVMSVVLGSLSTLRAIVPAVNQQTRTGLLSVASEILRPCETKLGFAAVAGEPPQEAQLRGQIMSQLGQFGDHATIERAQQLFAQWEKDKSSVETNLIGPVVTCVAISGDAARYEEFQALHKAASTPQEELRFLMALSSFRTAELAKRTAQSCIDGVVRVQDAPSLLLQLLSNTAVVETPEGGITIAAQTWKFIKDNWDTMAGKYPPQGMKMLCAGITSLVSPELEADVRKWFSEHDVKGAEKPIKQYEEQLAINVRLSERQAPAVKARFANNPSS